MAIKTFKPTTPSRRHMTVSAFEGIDKKAKPERSLVESQKKHAGRNSYGRITVRHIGGGTRRSTVSLTSSVRSSTFSQKSRPSSTTRTALPTSLSSSMRTARRHTSSLPRV